MWGSVPNKCSDAVWLWGGGRANFGKIHIDCSFTFFFERAIPIYANICQSGQGCEILCVERNFFFWAHSIAGNQILSGSGAFHACAANTAGDAKPWAASKAAKNPAHSCRHFRLAPGTRGHCVLVVIFSMMYFGKVKFGKGFEPSLLLPGFVVSGVSWWAHVWSSCDAPWEQMDWNEVSRSDGLAHPQ